MTLIDFMLPHGTSSDLIRIVRGDEGEVADMHGAGAALRLRRDHAVGDAARGRHDACVAGPDMVVLRTPAKLRGENFKTVAQFTVTEGETVPFVLSYQPSHLPLPEPIDPHDVLTRREISGGTGRRRPDDGPWPEASCAR